MDFNHIKDIVWEFVKASPVIVFAVQMIKLVWKNRPANTSIFLALGISLLSAMYLAWSTPVLPDVAPWLHWLTYLLAGAVVGTGSAVGLFESAVSLTSKAIDRNIEITCNEPKS